MNAPAPSSPFLILHRPTAKQNLIALLICALVLVVIRWPVLTYLDTRFIGGTSGDAGLYVWLVRFFSRDFWNAAWFQTPAFYPYGETLAWSDNFLLPGFFAWLLTKLGCSIQIAYNCIFLGASLLTGVLTFRVAFILSADFCGALSAAVLFLGSSYVSGMLGHPQLQFTCFFPLALLCLLYWITKRTLLEAALLGLAISLSFFTTVYYAIFIVVMVSSIIAALILLRPRALSRRDILSFGCGLALGLFPMLPLLPPYFRVREVFGERALYEAFYFSANAFSYLSSSVGSLLYQSSVAFSHEEARLFPGFIALALLVPSFFRLFEAPPLKKIGLGALLAILILLLFSFLAATNNPSVAPYLRYACALTSWTALGLLMVLLFRMGILERKLGFSILTNRALFGIILFGAYMAFVISLGPLGNPEKNQWALGVHRFWYELLPGFNSIRAVARIGVLFQFFLALNLALVIPLLFKKWPKYSRAMYALPALLLLENFNRYVPIEPLPGAGRAYEIIAAEAQAGGAAIVLPFSGDLNERGEPSRWGEFARLQVDAMNRLLDTNLAALNGYSGQRSKIMREWPQQLRGFPDQRSVQTLCSIAGLRYALFDSKLVPSFDQLEFIKKTANLSSLMKYVDADDAGNYLFELPCQSLLSERTTLLAPSNAPGVVTVELMTQFKNVDNPITIDVVSQGESESVPLTSLSVKTSGDWELFSIPIPQSADRIRPIRLGFRVSNNQIVYMRKPLYQRMHP